MKCIKTEETKSSTNGNEKDSQEDFKYYLNNNTSKQCDFYTLQNMTDEFELNFLF